MRPNNFPVVCSLIAMMMFSVVTHAQTGVLQGRIVMKQGGGHEVAVGGATIDVFRVDLPGRYMTKANENGEFVFAGLPYAGTYLLAASARGARPSVLANVKAGRDQDYRLVLEPGDGQRLTMDEAAEAAKTPRDGLRFVDETPDQVKARTFREGNNALRAEKYDEAIRLFEEGLAVFPPEIPFLVNLSAALRSRGVAIYNSINFSRDENMRRKLISSAHNDFRRAAEIATRAVDLIRVEPIAEDEKVRRLQQSTRYTAFSGRAEAMRLLVSMVDPSQATAALAAFAEYLDLEDDPNKKAKAELDAALMLLKSKNTNLAIEQYRGILIRNPNSIDALGGLGLSLYQSGDRNKFPEAAGYLQRFIEQAPEHSMRSAAVEALRKLNSLR